MPHHKRGRPKSRRAGCLMCKPHKDNARKGTRGARTFQDLNAERRQVEGWIEHLDDLEERRLALQDE